MGNNASSGEAAGGAVLTIFGTILACAAPGVGTIIGGAMIGPGLKLMSGTEPRIEAGTTYADDGQGIRPYVGDPRIAQNVREAQNHQKELDKLMKSQSQTSFHDYSSAFTYEHCRKSKIARMTKTILSAHPGDSLIKNMERYVLSTSLTSEGLIKEKLSSFQYCSLTYISLTQSKMVQLINKKEEYIEMMKEYERLDKSGLESILETFVSTLCIGEDAKFLMDHDLRAIGPAIALIDDNIQKNGRNVIASIKNITRCLSEREKIRHHKTALDKSLGLSRQLNFASNLRRIEELEKQYKMENAVEKLTLLYNYVSDMATQQ